MHVRFFGVRGSTPTPGPSTVRYGGNTVCVEARLADDTIIILDAGTGLRELGKSLLKEEQERAGGVRPRTLHQLLTHVHWDHIIGLPFFGPIWKKDTHLKIYPLANAEHEKAGRHRVLFDGVHFPVRAADIPAKLEFCAMTEVEWRIGSATVRRIALNHPGGCQGFRIDDDGGASFAYLTDNELSATSEGATSAAELARFIDGAQLVVHDAQYVDDDMPQKRGWGHSTVNDALELGKLAQVPHLVLFHHEPERDDDELDALGHSANAWLREHAPACRVTVAREGWDVEI